MQKLFFCTASLILLFQVGVAQSFNFSGHIVDAETNIPIPFATVFLSNTSIGASANENGSFTISNIPKGKYDIIISSLGYKTLTSPIEFNSQRSKESLTFKLNAESISLKEVTVETFNKKMYDRFSSFFIGNTSNAEHCSIQNPDDINIWYDEQTKMFRAEAAAPIVVENKALGYRVHYLLEEFIINDSLKTFRMFGNPRFEDLTPQDSKQQRQWNRARNTAYYGSINHFMKSLLKRESTQNHFVIRKPGDAKALKESQLFSDESSNILNYKGLLEVTFEGESEDMIYFKQQKKMGSYSKAPASSQYTIITFLKSPIKIYGNGYYEDKRNLIIDGYMNWTGFIADMLPLDFEPIKNTSKQN